VSPNVLGMKSGFATWNIVTLLLIKRVFATWNILAVLVSRGVLPQGMCITDVCKRGFDT